MSEVQLVQNILDSAPSYTLNTEGVTREPNGGKDALSALPPDCSKDQKHFLVVQSDHQPVGVVDLIRDFPDPGTSFIGLLLLREANHKRGLGRAAYEAVEAYAIREFASNKIQLAIVDSNPVQPFWEKMGFRETGVVKPHEGLNLKSTKRVMEKTLPVKPCRVRPAEPSDMHDVYMMGFDIWADGQSEQAYLDECHASPKYAQGNWYVLENDQGVLVSSLITYEFPQSDCKLAIGIGSIATKPTLRKQGMAGQLIWDTLGLFHGKAEVFYLYSDIEPEYYQRFDFIPLPAQFQSKPGSTAMIRCSNEKREKLLADPHYKPPGYF